MISADSPVGTRRATDLAGAWRLTTARFIDEDTGEQLDLFGSSPNGFVVFDRSGRMVTLITPGGRDWGTSADEPASRYMSMAAYSGRWSCDGETLVTKVDAAWDPGWVGTEQVRYCSSDGDTLSLRTAPLDHPAFPGRQVVGYLDWKRETP